MSKSMLASEWADLDGPLDTLDFALPPELEAREPPEARGLARDSVRLLVSSCDGKHVEHARFAELGCYLRAGDLLVINTSGTLPAELAEVAAWAPLERILVETDSPYLAPPPYRGKRNQPAHVTLVARRIAELRSLPVERLAAATTANAAALFRLPPLEPEEDSPAHASV